MSDQISNFVKLVVAVIQGDDAKVKALKIQKKAAAGLAAQIAVKKAKTLELEDTLEQAEESLATARINGGKEITDSSAYISTLLSTNRSVKEAKEALDHHNGVVEFLEQQAALVKA